MDKFLDGLQNKKLVGNKCPKCGKVFCPPRKICGDCFVECTEMVNLPETGTVKNFTATKWKVQERKSRKINKDIIVGLVQIDGTSNAMMIPLINVEPENVKEGMKVKVAWAKRIKGSPEDIAGFEPV